MATLLQLVQDVCDELSINRPNVAFSSTENDIRQLVQLTVSAGQELVKVFEWKNLIVPDYTFTTVNGQPDYALPAGYDRLVNDTEWDRTSQWPGIGPVSGQEWAWLKGRNIASVPRFRFRLVGSNFTVYPTPGGAYTFAFEYVSKNWVWVGGSGTTYASRWTADADTHVYDDRLMVLMTKAKYLAAKGLDSSIAQQEFMEWLDILKAQDKGAPTMTLGRRHFPPLVGPWSVPDGSWQI